MGRSSIWIVWEPSANGSRFSIVPISGFDSGSEAGSDSGVGSEVGFADLGLGLGLGSGSGIGIGIGA